jgi:hypothetical protein
MSMSLVVLRGVMPGIRLMVCALVLAAGCEDDEPAEPVEREDFCPGLALELCTGARDCCASAGESLDACVESQSEACERAVLLGGTVLAVGGIEIVVGAGDVAQDGRIAFDTQAAGDAVARARSAAMTCGAVDYPAFGTVHDAVREDQSSLACLDDEECERGYYCSDLTVRGRIGNCVRLPEADQPCTGSCAEGLICFEADEGGVRTCVPPREQGLSCDDDGECQRGLHCDRSTCSANKANGDACRRDVECASAYCAGETVCAQAPDAAPDDAWCAVD